MTTDNHMPAQPLGIWARAMAWLTAFAEAADTTPHEVNDRRLRSLEREVGRLTARIAVLGRSAPGQPIDDQHE